MEGKRKVILVAYPIGRVASFAVMGLLHLMHCDLGPEGAVKTKGKHNPKGYFEFSSHNDFLKSAFDGVYAEVSKPPDDKWLSSKVSSNMLGYEELVKSCFVTDRPIALKIPWTMALLFWVEMADEYDCRVVHLTCSIDGQAESLSKIWSNSLNRKMYSDIEFIKEWLKGWHLFSEKLVENSGLRIMDLSYEKLFSKPVETARLLASFCELPELGADKVRNWLIKQIGIKVEMANKFRYIPLLMCGNYLSLEV